METFFSEEEEEQEEEVEEDNLQVIEKGRIATYRSQTSAEKARANEEGEHETDSEGIPTSREYSAEELEAVLLDQLPKGDWNAVGRMAEQVEEDQKNVQELVEKCMKYKQNQKKDDQMQN